MDVLSDEIVTLVEERRKLDRRIENLKVISYKAERCKTDIDVAICYLYTEYKTLEEVLSVFPSLGSVREFWQKFLKYQDVIPFFQNFPTIFQSKTTETILRDLEVVVPMCEYCCDVFEFLPDDIKQEKQVINAFLQSSPSQLLKLGNALPLYPDLVASAIERLPLSGKDNYLRKELHDNATLIQLVQINPTVSFAWATAGGDFISGLTNEIQLDHATMLAFIQNQSIPTLHESLTRSKEFMVKAIQHEPACLQQTNSCLVGDKDLLIAALSNRRFLVFEKSHGIPKNWIAKNSRNRYSFYYPAATMIREELNKHKIFNKLILGSVMSTEEDNLSPFSLLNQGQETKMAAYLKPIAEFLDVPNGEKLTLLCKCRETLALAGYPWKDCC